MWIRSLLVAAAAALAPMTASADEPLQSFAGLFCQSSQAGEAIGSTFQTYGVRAAMTLASIGIGSNDCARYDVALSGRTVRQVAAWTREGRLLTLFEVELINPASNERLRAYAFTIGDAA